MSLLLSIVLLTAPTQPLAVHTAFAGGSGRVVKIDTTAHRVRILPKKQLRGGWESWWYVQITGLQVGKPFYLEVGKSPWATPKRAVFSVNGKVWRKTNRCEIKDGFACYVVKPTTTRMFFAWGQPFGLKNANTLIDRVRRKLPAATSLVIAKSRQQRPVLALSYQAPRHRLGVWIQARQHAWEVGSSWVGKGFIDWFASDDAAAK